MSSKSVNPPDGENPSAKKPDQQHNSQPTAKSSKTTKGSMVDVTNDHLGMGFQILGTQKPKE